MFQSIMNSYVSFSKEKCAGILLQASMNLKSEGCLFFLSTLLRVFSTQFLSF